MRIKNEKLFRRMYYPGCFGASGPASGPTELGRRQFHAHQSAGLVPGMPDPYYLTLTGGKTHFDWLSRELQQQWYRSAMADCMSAKMCWDGFAQLAEDWAGEEWVLAELLRWWKGPLPELKAAVKP